MQAKELINKDFERGFQCFAQQQARYLVGIGWHRAAYITGIYGDGYTRLLHHGAACPVYPETCPPDIPGSIARDANSLQGGVIWSPYVRVYRLCMHCAGSCGLRGCGWLLPARSGRVRLVPGGMCIAAARLLPSYCLWQHHIVHTPATQDHYCIVYPDFCPAHLQSGSDSAPVKRWVSISKQCVGVNVVAACSHTTSRRTRGAAT